MAGLIRAAPGRRRSGHREPDGGQAGRPCIGAASRRRSRSAETRADEHADAAGRHCKRSARRPPWARRDILKLGALVAAGGVAASAARGVSRTGQRPAASRSPVRSDHRPLARRRSRDRAGAARRSSTTSRRSNPGIEWDIRALPGGGPNGIGSRAPRSTSGEPVGLVMINGQQVRGWVRDGLLADLGADPGMADVLARVPGAVPPRRPGETTTRAFPLAVTGASTRRASTTTRRCSIGRASSRRRRSPTSRRWWSRWPRSARRRSSTAPATSSSTRCWSRGCCR